MAAGSHKPHIFNVMVGAIMQELLWHMLGAEASEMGYKDFVKVLLALFYAGDAIFAHPGFSLATGIPKCSHQTF